MGCNYFILFYSNFLIKSSKDFKLFSYHSSLFSYLFLKHKTLYNFFFAKQKTTAKNKKFYMYYNLNYQIDIFIRLLLPNLVFFSVFKQKKSVNSSAFSHLAISGEYLDIFSLLLYSNPLFINTMLYDVSAFINSLKKNTFKTLYYVFKVPTFNTWLVLFVPYESLSATNFAEKTNNKLNLISIEKLFKSASWGEREVGELFGINFFFKITNRKLITDYFFKVYPLLKWVPSIGFSEVYCSAEGYFYNRSVKVFNSALS